MHPSAIFHGDQFFKTYIPSPSADITVLEIGSQNVNGCLKDVAPKGIKYVGLDFVEGPGVDIVISDPYVLPLPDASVDMIVSSACFEHSEFFWLVFLEVMRVLKPQGIFYLNTPSNGFFHRYPVDCWRFIQIQAMRWWPGESAMGMIRHCWNRSLGCVVAGEYGVIV